MKRILCAMLAMLISVSFFSSCRFEETRDPAAQKNTAPGVPEDPGSSLVEYDPDRRIYITAQNYYVDFYGSGYFDFYIYSKEPLDMESITLDIPTGNEYELFIYAFEDLQKKTMGDSWDLLTFSSYLYHMYDGADWKTLGQLHQTDPAGFAEEKKTMTQAFRQMQVEDIPVFYLYQVCILFSRIQVDEVIETLDVIIGDQRFTQQIGCIQLSTESVSTPHTTTVLDINAYSRSNVREAWSDGTGQRFFWEWTPEENMTLMSLDFLQAAAVEDISISVYNWTKNSSYSWDGVSPLQMIAGEKIRVIVYFTDRRLRQLHGTFTYCGILNYETQDGAFSTVAQATVAKQPCVHEVFAIAFQGLDVEPYYRHYYFPVQLGKTVE